MTAGITEDQDGNFEDQDGGHRPPLQGNIVFKPRLQRLTWLFTDHPVYFITAGIQDRRWVLANVQIHNSFKTFARIATEFNVLVGRYIIMPDHVHFFVAFNPSSSSVSTWMKSWKNALSKTLNALGVPARHWEKDFFDHVIRSEESYEEKWRYVRENPVRAGLVKRSEDWPYQGEIHRLTAEDLPTRRRKKL